MKIEKKYIILLLFLILGVNSVKAHPFYVSICQVDFNDETNSLEIALKIFTDDLILGLENDGKTVLFIGEKIENPNLNKYIFEYLKSQMKFTINNKKVDFNFIGKEVENAVVWTYLEIENIDQLKAFGVESKLLTEVRESQSNIVQVSNNGTIKNILLNKNKTIDSIQF